MQEEKEKSFKQKHTNTVVYVFLFLIDNTVRKTLIKKETNVRNDLRETTQLIASSLLIFSKTIMEFISLMTFRQLFIHIVLTDLKNHIQIRQTNQIY